MTLSISFARFLTALVQVKIVNLLKRIVHVLFSKQTSLHFLFIELSLIKCKVFYIIFIFTFISIIIMIIIIVFVFIINYWHILHEML